MRFDELLNRLGIGARPRTYSFELVSYQLERDGEVGFARWQHPRAASWKLPLTQAMVDEARHWLKPGDTAIDVGAHTGASTLPLALAAGATGAVLALEPNPHVFKVLLATSALNRRSTNIYPLMFAAVPEDGELVLEYSDSGYCGGAPGERVSGRTHARSFRLRVKGRNLARYLEREFPRETDRLRFIKVDAEGFGRTVVSSLVPLLERTSPFVRSEVYPASSAAERRRIWADLRAMGYRVHKLDAETHYKGQELDEGDMMRWQRFGIFCVREEGA